MKDENLKIKNHIIIGDFNINIYAVDNPSLVFLNNFLDMNYVPYFNHITRPSEAGGSCIGNMFVKVQLNGIKSYTYINVFTDH